MCKPLAVSSVRQCHAVLSGALNTAKRWGWITVNPLDAAHRPRLPASHPIRRRRRKRQRSRKTHQIRVIKLDQDAISILTNHKQHAQHRCVGLGTILDDDAFVFSYAPTTDGTSIPTPSAHR